LSETGASNSIVYTYKAHCRDCYRCVRVCPVKAVRMTGGQAFDEPERCIACGSCIRECPQHAKRFRNDLPAARELLASGAHIAVSVAPSFAAAFTEWERRCLPSALRRLGFAHVSETAVGAYYVAGGTADCVGADPEAQHIFSACPAVVSYIERYAPDMTDRLTPVVSPMIAHSRHLKRKLGPATPVVFVGPCVAKKAEAERPEYAGEIACALTFAELREWLASEGIDLAACEESAFDEEPLGAGRYFALEGGNLRTALMSTDLLSLNVATVSGYEEFRDALDSMAATSEPLTLEPLFCPQGCVGGPGMGCDAVSFARRAELLRYAETKPGAQPEPEVAKARFDLATVFTARTEAAGPVPAELLRKALEATGKYTVDDELNCGACGYASCRDKAEAVVLGMAELEMCIPHMKRLAERRTDRIIETSPNGIVILDSRLAIVSMNAAFKEMFACSDAVCGRGISYLMDQHPFERVASGQQAVVNEVASHDRYHLVTHQLIYAMPEDEQIVGIFVNITKSEADLRKLNQLRAQAVHQAEELLQQQIEMAQGIARTLGEGAARGEQLVASLVQLMHDDAERTSATGERGGLCRTYTSK
jgi:iron only hydrogenase large subunit-like protein/uncharacterized Fe-S cluster-containing protein